MNSKMIFACIAGLLFIPVSAFSEPAVLINFTGKVEVSRDADEPWRPAVIRMKIEEGGSIRTFSGGGALVLMPNKTRAWMRENSLLEIEQKKNLVSRLNFLFGKIKVKVPHLLRGELFRVRTPAAVCAVRGTEFTAEVQEDGGTKISVLYGEVRMKYAVPPSVGESEILLPQGHSVRIKETGARGDHYIMSKGEEREGLSDWEPGLRPEERDNLLEKKEKNRAEIRRFAADVRQANNKVKSFTSKVKESDLEAGRTLKDMHGNLVRVDQRLMRPDGKTLQFFNLVKRPVYNHTDHSDAQRFTYNGDQGISDRLDLAQMNMVFNKTIPDRIEKWPGFFDEGSVYAEKAAFIAANKTDADNIFFTAEYYLRDKSRDELVNNARVIYPDMTLNDSHKGAADRDVLISGVVGDNDFKKIADVTSAETGFKIKDDGNGTGTLEDLESSPNPITGAKWGIKLPSGSGVTSWEKTDPAETRLYQFQADAYRIGGVDSLGNVAETANDYFWLARENYVINNNGNLAENSNFTNTTKDTFSLLKEHAFQTQIYVKQSNSSGGSLSLTADTVRNDILSSDYFTHNSKNNNIDLVIIPDLPVAAVQRMLTVIDKFGN